MNINPNVWQTLSAINVNEHTNQKGKFTYLSWSWAWATLMEHYPDSSFKFKEDMHHVDQSVEIWCEVTVEGVTREMWLAVTDGRNQPITKPSCDHIANARMRCLVKCLAMFGLGHYIYAGEGLPLEVYEKPYTDEEYTAFMLIIEEENGLGMIDFIENHTQEVYANLGNSSDKGKVKFKAKIADIMKQGQATLDDIFNECVGAIDDGDAVAFNEQVEGLSSPLKSRLAKQFTPEQLNAISLFKQEK